MKTLNPNSKKYKSKYNIMVNKTRKLRRKTRNKYKKRLKGNKSKGNKSKGKSKGKIRMKFVDVPVSTRVSMGSLASEGTNFYHYQAYSNYYYFWDYLVKNDDLIKDLLCWPFEGKHDWNNFFIKVKLEDNTDMQTTELVKQNVEPVGYIKEWKNIAKTIKECKKSGKRFFMMPIMLTHPIMVGSHANIILVDTKEKIISLLEPHGKRKDDSTLESIDSAYFLSDKFIKKFFSKILNDYEYISPQDFMGSNSLQSRIDAGTGLCVTWGILFVHYRLLNLDKSLKQIIKYLDKKITKNFILKYVRLIEETIKGKSN